MRSRTRIAFRRLMCSKASNTLLEDVMVAGENALNSINRTRSVAASRNSARTGGGTSLSKATQRKKITCPTGANAGQRFIVRAKDGQSVEFVLPKELLPGQRFEVDIPVPKSVPGDFVDLSVNVKDMDKKYKIREVEDAIERQERVIAARNKEVKSLQSSLETMRSNLNAMQRRNGGSIESSDVAEVGCSSPSSATSCETKRQESREQGKKGVNEYRENEFYVQYKTPENRDRSQRSYLMQMFNKFGIVRKLTFPQSLGKVKHSDCSVAYLTVEDAAMSEKLLAAFADGSHPLVKVLKPVYSDRSSQIFIKNVPPKMSNEELCAKAEELVLPFGRVERIDVRRNGGNRYRAAKKFLYVSMLDVEVEDAIVAALDGKITFPGMKKSLVVKRTELSEGELRTHKEAVDALSGNEVPTRVSKAEFLERVETRPLSSMSQRNQKRIDELLTSYVSLLTEKEFIRVLRKFAYDGQFERSLDMCRLLSNQSTGGGGPATAFDSFKKTPEVYGYLITANIRSQAFDIDTILSIMRVMREKQIAPDIITVNKILTQCWKESDVRGVELVCDQLRWLSDRPNRDTFRPIVGTFAKQFNHDKVARTIREMEKMGINPGIEIFAMAVRSCRKDVDRAREYFDIMQRRWGIQPNIFHYTELLEVYARAGRREDIANIANEMREADVEMDDIFALHWGRTFLTDGSWQKCVEIFAENFTDFDSVFRDKMPHVLTTLKKYKRWDALAEYFEFVDDKYSGFVRGGDMVHAIHAYGNLGRWDDVLDLEKRMKASPAWRNPKARKVMKSQAAATVRAAKLAREKGGGDGGRH